MSVKRSSILLALLVLSSLAIFGCAKVTFFSARLDRPIIIDGKYTDWDKTTAYYDEKTKSVINLANDENYLYVCLITRNRVIETRVMESGLIAWFDKTGEQKKEFGIRFPVGLKRMGISLGDEERLDMDRDWRDQKDISGLIDREKERSMDKSFNKRLETLEGLQEKLEILKEDPGLKKKKKMPEKKDKPDELSLAQTGKFGIEAKVGRENDYFVYELKVPLAKSSEHIYAIEAKPGQLISLGLETGERERGIEERESMLGASKKLKLWFNIALS